MRSFLFVRIAVIAGSAFVLSLAANAGMPRGAELIADEQDADPATGITIARGNAEIRIESYRILGRADRIDVDPGRNEIQFIGHALITVGDSRFESERVTCSLDFEKCAASTAEPSVVREATQAWAPPAGSGAAAINP